MLGAFLRTRHQQAAHNVLLCLQRADDPKRVLAPFAGSERALAGIYRRCWSPHDCATDQSFRSEP